MKWVGWVLSIGQSGVAKIQPGKHPNCVGGENRSSEYAIVVNCCAELKSHSVHAKVPLVMLPLHHHHPQKFVLGNGQYQRRLHIWEIRS